VTLTALDHVALVVRDLDAALDGYTRLLGREPNWRGADGGAHHAWYQFGNMALDVIAPTGEGHTGSQVRKQLDEHGEGIWALAFATPDIAAERGRIERLSMPSTEPLNIRSTHPETGEKRRWMTSVIDREAGHGMNLFLIEQKPGAEAWPTSPAAGDEAAAVSGLDHVVVSTRHPERAAALYGARLGLDFKLDRSNPDWGTRLMFFKVGDLVVEVAHRLKDEPDAPDSPWGLSWRAPDVEAARGRMAAAGLEVSEIRTGRKPGTKVFTVKNAPGNVPTLIIGAAS
jgi:catechol 2,3-dioxygenase-like lactoylglutathione lyase family enzyme